MEVLDGEDVSEVSIMGGSNCTMLCLGGGGWWQRRDDRGGRREERKEGRSVKVRR